MDTSELEAILEAGTETQKIEVKGACEWNVRNLAKDILALSNVQDGGLIIIGVEDGTFKREGVTEVQKKTFNIDVMRDQMTAYADPHVQFTVSSLKDTGGLEFVVIRVSEFEDVPIICRKDGDDTKSGTIYYRNRNRRMESAAVSNSTDMRDIIMRAAMKTRYYFEKLGLQSKPSLKKILDAELGSL